ncbi:MAG: hypothetical protein HY566_03190 [Candidatus Kerfeldbacteria bacterium]|nr:hypothetical protein [Candidatus Kerfeldbacteria bacterium]
MLNTSVQVPQQVPQEVLFVLQRRAQTAVHRDGIVYIASQGGKRITAKIGSFAAATYNKNGRRTDQPVHS